MRVVRPGKLFLKSVSSNEKKSEPLKSRPERQVWDDYAFTSKKKGKRREYINSGNGNRLVPKPFEEKVDSLRELEASEGEGFDERERVKPRSDYDTLEERLGYNFSGSELLERALTHRSAVGLKERADYERLEFLGDAVLDLAVAHLLSDRHPEAREGELSKMRAALVNTQALAEIARRLELGPFIRLGRGELSSGGSDRPSILADVTEAVIGAVYRDSSYEQALEIIESVFDDMLDKVTPHDPKTELQEALHAAGSEPPSYLLELVEGPEHAPTFVTVVVVDGEIVGRGRGTTKKGAQQEAASHALSKMCSSQTLSLIEGQEVFIEDALLCNYSLGAA